MIDARVLNIQPHPDQATNNPGCWAVRFEVSYGGRRRTFWRWHTDREFSSRPAAKHADLVAGRLVAATKKPRAEDILRHFWDDTFAELHGFAFDKEAP